MLNSRPTARTETRVGGSASCCLLVGLTLVCTLATVQQLSAQDLPPARPSRAPAKPTPTPVAKLPATLMLVVDGAAHVVMDGQDLGEFAADEMRGVPVGLGEHFVIATSTEEPSVKLREVVTIEAPGQKVVSFELAGKVRSWQEKERAKRAQEQTKRAQEQTKRAQEQAKRARVLEMESRFRPIGGGVLQDTKKPLQWTARDNGTDIDWNNASAYCGGLRLGGNSDWRLATIYELSELYLKDAPGDPCGSVKCKIYPGFDLTSFWLWSGDRNGSSTAWLLDFGGGRRNSFNVGNFRLLRALCVRRSGG